ncbi:unnamed protein product [Protopolystoma xenopodis]|uniref:Uncharacterized protein n=1 Tax=Protopolystoma xenopodis TaxID=117903 RepID=A0A448X8X3_9PLAT|nr:unnamed protein product [Protopolystoma xenopodis]
MAIWSSGQPNTRSRLEEWYELEDSLGESHSKSHCCHTASPRRSLLGQIQCLEDGEGTTAFMGSELMSRTTWVPNTGFFRPSAFYIEACLPELI